MQPTTFGNAKAIIARATGKSLVGDRLWIEDMVNKIRRMKWKVEASRLLYFKAEGCECVQCFDDPCATCNTGYSGISLPQNVTGLRYLEVRGKKIDLTNERLGSGGCCSSGCGCVAAEMLPTRAPTYRPIPAGYKGVIVFKGLDAADDNKRVGVEYVMRNGTVRREDVLLSKTGRETKYSLLRFNMVTFPVRCGWIDIQTQEGFSLGSYHPSILAPAHYRLRLLGVQAGDVVKWEGLKEPHDLRFDTDLVEWADPLEWENDLQWLDLHFKTNKTPAEERTYAASGAFSKAGSEAELAATQSVPIGTLRPNGPKSLRRAIRRMNRI